MGFLARFDLASLVSRHRVTHFIEAEHGDGDACRTALQAGFEQALSCESETPAAVFLASAPVRKTLAEHRSFVFLNAPFNTDDDATRARPPLFADLDALQNHAQDALVLIDDIRVYRRAFDVAAGPLADESPNAFAHEDALLALLAQFDASHTLHWHAHESGYAVLWPRAWGECDLKAWIFPGDSTQSLRLWFDVPGTTCMSLNRRLQDARFSNRWLVGHGLDIGGGKDSIALYRQLFPGMQGVTVYDWAQGDAQYLRNVHDDSFDFVYSAHCLEHMVDPRIALRHWLRVLKPGGHMVITVPDEDMYEQGVWPSSFNNDHKHTFAMFKRESWSPVSINVLDLLREFEGEVEIAKVERLDHAFLHGIERFDQTRTAFAECGIEFVLRKV